MFIYCIKNQVLVERHIEFKLESIRELNRSSGYKKIILYYNKIEV